MPYFRKKPVVIEAVRLKNGQVIPAAQTLHDHDLVVKPGEWLIKGVKGELYPCEDSIFRETYEPVNGKGVHAMIEKFPDEVGEPVILAHPMRDKFEPIPLANLYFSVAVCR